jgi:hypothetical protein
MIPAVNSHVAVSSGTLDSTQFGISMTDSAHLMEVLRDTLYTDKVMAVLREYGSNAWDAHRMVGKTDLPIKVTIPSGDNKFLVIRDFGPGISQDDMLRIFTQYGASSKRDSNAAVGMLGIGSKSGFSYAESFEVTSFHEGVKRSYVCAMDASNKGLLNLLHEEPTEESGFEVRLAVKAADTGAFQQKATSLFQHFVPRPEINVALPAAKQGVGETKSGAMFSSEGNHWTAVMGCVPYRLNLLQVEGVPEFLKSTSGVLYFDIGEVQVSASREELKYSEKTKQAVISKLDAMLDEFGQWILNEVVNNPSMDDWQRRWLIVSAASLVPSVKAIPTVADLMDRVITNDDTSPFTAYTVNRARSKLVVHTCKKFHAERSHEFVIAANIAHYVSDYRSAHHIVLVPRVEGADAQAFLKEKKLDGAPVKTMEQLKNEVVLDKKAKKHSYNVRTGRTFALFDNVYTEKNWRKDDLPADSAFILVPLDRFRNERLANFSSWSAVATALGLSAPPVYGIRKSFLTEAVWKKFPNAVNLADWTGMIRSVARASPLIQEIMVLRAASSLLQVDRATATFMVKPLQGHDLLPLFTAHLRGQLALEAAVAAIDIFSEDDMKKIRDNNDKLISRYPLLPLIMHGVRYGGFNVRAANVVDYIKMIDERIKP